MKETINSQGFFEHLKELRARILKSFLGIFICFVPLIYFSNPIYMFVSKPLQVFLPEASTMIATEVASPFLTPIKLTFFVSLLISTPYILYQVWGFISPGMYRHEKIFAYGILFSSVILFYLGIIFTYYVVFPLMFGFFTSTAPEGISIMTDIGSYLDFILIMFLAFSFSFEVPIFIVLLTWAGITTPENLSSNRPYIIIGCFILGMLLTPPDVISQSLLALPTWILFEVGILLSKLIQKKKKLNL